MLLDDGCENWGAGNGWMNFGDGQGGTSGIAVGKRVEGICNRVMEEVGECVLYWLGRCGREGSNCCSGRLLLDIGPPLVAFVASRPP